MSEVGQFQLIKRLATGGMAEIFLARQRSVAGFERNVVVKKILPEFSEDQSFVESFLNEARLAAQLNHPNIVQIIDLGLSGRSYFIAMEYIRGFDASTILRYCRANKIILPLGVAVSIGRDLLSALDYAHEARDVDGHAMGIVHRDVTPSNLLVTLEGSSKVVDFGIAKATARGENKTRTGTVKGKLSYLAPEQVLSMEIDRRVDVFSASIVLYELIALSNPFRGESEYATLKNIVELVPVALDVIRTEVPAALAHAVARGLAQDRDQRYASCAALLNELERTAAAAGLVVATSAVREFITEHRVGLEALVATEKVELFEPTASEMSREISAPSAPGAVRASSNKAVWIGFALLGAAIILLVIARLLFPLTLVAPSLAVETPPPASAPAAKVVEDTKVEEPVVIRAHDPKSTPKTQKKPDPKPAVVTGPPAKVRFVIQPWGEVEVDGKARGMTPLPVLELSPGKHKIVIRNSEVGRSITKNITAGAGESLEIRHNF